MRCEDPTAHTWKIEHWPRRLHCPSFEHRCRDESVEVKAISSVPVYCWMFSWFFWWFWKGNPKFGPTSTSLKFGPNSITEKFSHDEDTNTAVVSPWWPSQLSSLGVTRQGRTASNCAQWKMLASKSGCRFVKHRSGEPCYRYWMKLVTSPTWFVNVRQVFSSGNLQIRPSTVTAIWSYLICMIYEPGCLWGEKLREIGAESAHRVTWTEATPPEPSRRLFSPTPSRCALPVWKSKVQWNWQLQSTSNHQSILCSDVHAHMDLNLWCAYIYRYRYRYSDEVAKKMVSQLALAPFWKLSILICFLWFSLC